MIRYALRCACGHDFDAWFGNGAAYDEQAARRLVECPLCGGHEVQKAPMAPAIGRRRQTPADPAKVRAALAQLARHVKANAENVGARFPDEARKIHEGVSDERPIWGQATLEDARTLREDGIDVLPLPDVPEHDA